MLAEFVRVNMVFQRNKVSLEKKLLGALLCFAGLSYRRSAGLVGGLLYTAVRNAFIALSKGLPSLRGCIVDA
jgi:hypothetical protein